MKRSTSHSVVSSNGNTSTSMIQSLSTTATASTTPSTTTTTNMTAPSSPPRSTFASLSTMTAAQRRQERALLQSPLKKSLSLLVTEQLQSASSSQLQMKTIQSLSQIVSQLSSADGFDATARSVPATLMSNAVFPPETEPSKEANNSSNNKAKTFCKTGRDFYDDGYYDSTAAAATPAGTTEGSHSGRHIGMDYSDEDEVDSLDDRLDHFDFYGRTKELKELQSMYQSVMVATTAAAAAASLIKRPKSFESLPTTEDNTKAVCWVRGPSGTGKSKLMQEFMNKTTDASLLCGKYDQIHGGDPYSAILQALSNFVRSSSYNKDNLIQNMSQFVSMNHDTDRGGDVTVSTIESNDNSNNNNHVGMSWNTIKYFFRSFIKGIATKERPVILFLDDLQWADNESLDLITTVLNDRSLEYFIFVGAYRSDEVHQNDKQLDSSQMHPLAKLISLQERQKQQMKFIDIHNLDLPESIEFIGHALKMDDNAAEELVQFATAIHSKTRGNIFFTIQVLEELHRKGILFFSRMTFAWEWNLEGVDLEEGLPDNVVAAVISKIISMPHDVQKILKIMAYARSTMSMDTLQKLLAMDGMLFSKTSDFLELLDRAVLEGLFSNTIGSNEYRFAHDRIQQASFSLVPEGSERDQFRYLMGHRLLKLAKASNRNNRIPNSDDDNNNNNNASRNDWMLFAAIDHFNATHDRLHHDPLFITRINLQVAEKSAALGAYETSSQYLQHSMANLMRLQHPWKKNYDTALRLYRTIAQVEFYQGHFELGSGIASQIFDNAKSLEHKLPTKLAMIVALGRRQQHAKAMDLNREVLIQLKVFPKRRYMFAIIRDMIFVKRYFRSHSDDDFLALPRLSSKQKEREMSLLDEQCIQCLYCGNVLEFLVSMLRMLRCSIEHGLCSYSAQAVSKYCIVLCNQNDTRGARRAADLAFRLLEVINAKNVAAKTTFSVVAWVKSWNQPVQVTLKMLQNGHRAGMEVGDVEYAFMNSAGVIICAFMAGYPLSALELAGLDLLDKLETYRVQSIRFLQEQLQLTVKHLVHSTVAEEIDWEAMAYIKPEEDGQSDMYRFLFGTIYRCATGLYFGNYEFADAMADRSMEYIPRDTSFIVVVPRHYFGGLAASRMGANTGQRSYIRKAGRHYKRLKFCVANNGSTGAHRLQIMLADIQSAQGRDESRVRPMFDQAIEASIAADHIHDAAIASELAGLYYVKLAAKSSEKGNTIECSSRNRIAGYYLTQARNWYADWGAKAKVSHIEETHKQHIEPTLQQHLGEGLDEDHSQMVHHSVQSQNDGPLSMPAEVDILAAVTPVERMGARARQSTSSLDFTVDLLDSSNKYSIGGSKGGTDGASVLTDPSGVDGSQSDIGFGGRRRRVKQDVTSSYY